MTGRKLPRWPLFLIAAPAAVAVWSGWVGLGSLSGFGIVHPLPGIDSAFRLNTAITLPIGVEAYGAYALGVWLAPAGVPERARVFARWSAIGALVLGISGQIIYHLLASRHATLAPAAVIVLVSCLPVITLGFGTALTHLLRNSGDAETGNAAEAELQADAEVPPAAVLSAETELPGAARVTVAASGGRPGGGSGKAAAPGAASQSGNRPVPGPVVPSPRRQRPASEAELSNREKALDIVAKERGISGAELGRILGVSERQGRNLRTEALDMLAELEGGNGTDLTGNAAAEAAAETGNGDTP